jgi:hypothetical protein
MLHPIALLSAATLALNDHVLKSAFGAWWTGKLSDVAGLVLFPFVLVAAAELVAAARGRYHGPDARTLRGALAATAVGFALVKLVPVAGTIYAHALAALQWPVRARWIEVTLVQDATDLLALPALVVAWLAGRGRIGAAAPGRIVEKLVLAAAAALCVATSGEPQQQVWIVAGEADGPGLTLATAETARFLVVYRIPPAALPEAGRTVRFTATLSAGVKAAPMLRVEWILLEPARPAEVTTLTESRRDWSLLHHLERPDLACDAAGCVVRAEVRFAVGPPNAAELTWSATALLDGGVVEVGDGPPDGTRIAIEISAVE